MSPTKSEPVSLLDWQTQLLCDQQESDSLCGLVLAGLVKEEPTDEKA